MTDQSDGRRRAFLSNGLSGVLETDGKIEWFPCPRFDSPSIFSSILDEQQGGHFSVRPFSRYKLSTSYIGNSLVVRNDFRTTKGRLKVVDFMPIGIPAIIRIFESDVKFYAEIKPRFGYGRRIPVPRFSDGTMLFEDLKYGGALTVRISQRYRINDKLVEIAPGSGSIVASYGVDAPEKLDPHLLLDNTLRYWGSVSSRAKKTKSFGDAYERSVAVVNGLVYRPSGAIVAAPTTSLPEIVGEARNWDYRYAWVRDSAFAAEALILSGFMPEARRILDFLFERVDKRLDRFRYSLYRVEGPPMPIEEEQLDWLSGNGSKPVRIGNAAYGQLQMDTEGEFLDVVHRYITESGDLTYASRNWRTIERIAMFTSRAWRRSSMDIWEERWRSRRHFVHTKAMEWVAVDRAARIGRLIGKDTSEFSDLADEIRANIMKNGLSHDKKGFTKIYGSNEVDSSLLTLPLYSFIEARDPLFTNTLARIEAELGAGDGFLIRYRRDGYGYLQHPFLLLSSWLARVYIRLGNKKRARQILERLTNSSTPLLLFGEHVDLESMEPRGNFPQLFSHAGLITAIMEYEALSAPR